jgi:plasmid stabilization system protein ParE
MKVVYHPDVQRDVSRILRHYDRIHPKLGDAFWSELNALVKQAENPQHFHFDQSGRRRVNLKRFPYHFLFRETAAGIRIIVVRGHKQHPGLGKQRH